MNYLLDTDIIIDHLRGKISLDESLVNKDLFITIISYTELITGAYKSTYKEKNLTQIRKLLDGLGIQVVNLDQEIILRYAEIKSYLESKGNRLDDFDLFIAATALRHNFILLTRNIKHFSRIKDLKIL